MLHELEGLGLTKNEIVVYLTLLKVGQSTTGRILKEGKITNGRIYEVLDKLIEKGLVSYILKNNTKYFSASSPSKLKEYVKKKKQEVENKEKELNKILPDLEALKKVEEEYSTEIFMGIEGIKSAFNSAINELKTREEFIAFGVSGLRTTSIEVMYHQLSNLTKKKKIKARLIVTDTSPKSKKLIQNYKKEYYDLNCRFLQGFSLAPIDVIGNTTIIFNFENLSAIVIKNEVIAKQFRFFFESLWKVAKE